MQFELQFIIKLALALLAACAISFLATPVVKAFAHKVGAIDVPKEARRVHDHPIPRLGGLAIFLAFLLTVVLFADVTKQVQGILLGAVVVVIVGAIDDIVPLPALVKFGIQIVAAVIAVAHGVVIEIISNPNVMSESHYVTLGIIAIPVTIFWIVAITNSVNLIDGLDGLAVGVSAIASITMLIISLVVADKNVALILAALAGACIGFMPYNLNPAKIFMGDTGALLLGFVLSTVSIIGFFKFYAIISFAVPLLALGLPIFDTAFAFCRRIIKGQNPMKPDRGHFHHRLIDMGLSQKQAVAILYLISVILGVCAVVITTSGEIKALILIGAFAVALCIGIVLLRGQRQHKTDENGEPGRSDRPEEETGTPETAPAEKAEDDGDQQG